MSNHKYPAVLPILVFCLAVSLWSAALTPGAHALSASAESLVIGGSDCSDLMDGFAVGMGIGAVFGCVWCAAAAIGAKAIGLFC